jgi:hypothetical protein
MVDRDGTNRTKREAYMEELGGTLLFLAIIVAPIILGLLMAYGVLQRRRRNRASAATHDAAHGTTIRGTQAGTRRDPGAR